MAPVCGSVCRISYLSGSWHLCVALVVGDHFCVEAGACVHVWRCVVGDHLRLEAGACVHVWRCVVGDHLVYTCGGVL